MYFSNYSSWKPKTCQTIYIQTVSTLSEVIEILIWSFLCKADQLEWLNCPFQLGILAYT